MNAPIEPMSLIPRRANNRSPSPLTGEGRGEGGIHEGVTVTVDSISFRYSDNTPEGLVAAQGNMGAAHVGRSQQHPWLYQNLSFNIQPGHCVVLMGPSGSGKSTLAKLLLAFHLPQQGSIKLDGRDIRHLAANELRAHFGAVPQETVLFSGTIL